jgi:hypothetical protein
MAAPEAENLREQALALRKKIEASRERQQELSREVQRALEKLRRLAAA